MVAQVAYGPTRNPKVVWNQPELVVLAYLAVNKVSKAGTNNQMSFPN